MLTGFLSLIHIIAVASITAVCLWILIRQHRIHRRLKTSAGAGEDLRLRRQSRRVLIVGLTALALVMASRITPLLVGSGEMESGHPGASPDKAVSAVEPGGDQIREIRLKIVPPPENAPREVPAEPASPPESLEKPADPAGETSPPKPVESVAEASAPKPAEPAAEASAPKPAEPAAEASDPKPAEHAAEASPMKPAAAQPPRKKPEPKNPPAPASKEEISGHPYTVHVTSHKDRDKAMLAASRFTADGDAAFTSPARIAGKGTWHRVFIGFYRNRQEAAAAAERLKQRSYPYVMVSRQPYAVQVGLFESGEKLAGVRSDLEKKGFVPYSIPESGSGKVRLLVGFFETADEARDLKNELEKEGILSRVVSR